VRLIATAKDLAGEPVRTERRGWYTVRVKLACSETARYSGLGNSTINTANFRVERSRPEASKPNVADESAMVQEEEQSG
jgi:hypothetical protein